MYDRAGHSDVCRLHVKSYVGWGRRPGVEYGLDYRSRAVELCVNAGYKYIGMLVVGVLELRFNDTGFSYHRKG